MKRLIISICFFLVLVPQGLGHAGVKEDYEQAYKLYVAAGACMAAYSDRYGQLANKYLEREGWRIERFEQVGNIVDARFMLARKQAEDGTQMFVLAFVGTENEKDMLANLRVEKVYFAGGNLEEFAVNAAKQGIPTTEPKIHRGFHEFVQAGLMVKAPDADGESKYLTEMLLANQERKVYLVGHSRGGAAATLAGARLISMGAKPGQIEIITFGAPAVGNAAFAARFEPVLNLTRVVVSGDPVMSVLQTFVGGYKQFGREVKWENPVSDRPHEMAEYADHAIKDYYDKRYQALNQGVIQLPNRLAGGTGKGRVYIASLKNSLPEPLTKEFWYIEQALRDEYRQSIPEYVFGDSSAVNHLLKRAGDAGCKWLVVPEIGGYRLKDEPNVFYISLTQTVYDVATSSIVKTGVFSTGTFNLTPLGAFIHVSKGMTYDWLIKK